MAFYNHKYDVAEAAAEQVMQTGKFGLYPNYDVKDVIKYLKMFKGHVIIQTMFLRGCRR